MTDIIIRPCSLAEIEHSSTLHELLEEYSRESSIPELGQASPCMKSYHAMVASGVLHVIGVFADSWLIGMATVLLYGLPHYSGRKVAVTESFFVSHAFRSGGTGMRLLRAAEDLAREHGAQALMVSAPAKGRLAIIMDRTADYREANRVFIKGLA